MYHDGWKRESSLVVCEDWSALAILKRNVHLPSLVFTPPAVTILFQRNMKILLHKCTMRKAINLNSLMMHTIDLIDACRHLLLMQWRYWVIELNDFQFREYNLIRWSEIGFCKNESLVNRNNAPRGKKYNVNTYSSLSNKGVYTLIKFWDFGWLWQ